MTSTPHSAEHERDSADLAQFGYKQELKRSLGLGSSFAVAFSYISPSTGIFTLFALGLTTIGGVFIWTWPVVALGQFLVALNFAEVSSHYPVAGSVFQWTKYLASRTYSWFTGWIYLFAGILTVTAVVATIPIALIPALNGLGWHSLNAASLHTQLVVALIVLVIITVLNIYGVRLVALINNTGVIFEILGMFVFAIVLMIFHNHQGFKVVTNSAGLHVGPSTFLAAMFMSLFVIYGFDTASTLAEETRDPRRAAPKAVLFSVIGAFVIGGVFLLGTLMAIPNMHTAVSDAWNPANGDRGQLPVRAGDRLPAGGLGGDLRLLPVHPGRDDPAVLRHVPGQPAAVLRAVVQGLADLHTPVWACIVVAVLAAVPFLKYSGAGIIAIAATGMIYLSYFLGNLVIMRARLRGWPKISAPFSLRRWGPVVNVLALLYGGAMLVNFAWPRAASNPEPPADRRAAELRDRVREPDPDPVDRGRGHYADRRDLLPGRRAAQAVRPGDRAGRGRRAAGDRGGGPAGELSPWNAGRGCSRSTPPVIVREPGTTMHGQIEEWLAEAIEAGGWPRATGCRPSRTWPPGSGSAG